MQLGYGVEMLMSALMIALVVKNHAHSLTEEVAAAAPLVAAVGRAVDCTLGLAVAAHDMAVGDCDMVEVNG